MLVRNVWSIIVRGELRICDTSKNGAFCRPFQRRVIVRAKAFRSVINRSRKPNFWLQVWLRQVSILMLLLNRRLPFIIKSKLRSHLFWFWKLLILYKNKEGSFLSPVHKHLKDILAYTRDKKGTRMKKMATRKQFVEICCKKRIVRIERIGKWWLWLSSSFIRCIMMQRI